MLGIEILKSALEGAGHEVTIVPLDGDYAAEKAEANLDFLRKVTP